MLGIPERNRNSAYRGACVRARRGDEKSARAWLEHAEIFAPLSDRQREHFEDCVADGRDGAGIPGQLRLEESVT